MKAQHLILLVFAVGVAGSLIGGAMGADEKTSGKADSAISLKDVKCPLSGGAVDPARVAEFEKCKVFFCCDKCEAAFKKDPAKYAAKAHYQMFQTKQLVETACPFSGHPLDPAMTVEVGAVKVAFCCDECQAKAKKAKGDEQVNLIFKDISKGFKLAKDVEKKSGDSKTAVESRK